MSKLEEIKKNLDINKNAGCMDYLDLSDDVEYLLSIIESVEQDLSIIANSENVSSMNAIAEEALQAIRGVNRR